MEGTGYPKIKNAVGLCFLFIGFQVVLGLILGVFVAIFNFSEQSNIYNVSLLLVQLVSFGIVFLVSVKKVKIPITKIVPFKKVPWPVFFYSLLFAIGFVILSSELDNIISVFLPMSPFMKKVFGSMVSADNILLTVMLIAVIPAFLEEILFRGIMLHGFTRNYSPVKSIFVSALLFGLIHLNPWQFVSGFIIGIFSAWIFIESKSILICILIHFLNNGLYLLTMKIPKLISIRGFNSNYSIPVVFQPVWFDLIGIVLVLSGLYLLHAFFVKSKPSKTEIASGNAG